MSKHRLIIEQARAFFAAIPESDWCVNSFQDSSGRCCAIGHWRKNNRRFTDLYLAIIDCYPQEIQHLVPAIDLVNDGHSETHLDDLPTPRLRVLAYLDNALQAEAC